MSPPPLTSLAVLPLINAGGNPDVDYFAGGLTDLLHGALSGVRALRVLSRGAASVLQGQLTGPELGRALDVSAILEGSVSRLGDQVRLSVRLSDATDGGTLWSTQRDSALDELFPTMGEIVRHVLEALHVEPTSEERPALAHVPTRDAAALDAYLRAREVSEEIRRASQDVAVHLYGDAVLADAAFGLAHAGLANAHALLFTYWVSSGEHLQVADASSARAVELAPELAETHVARAVALSLNKQEEAAERAFQTALALKPGLFEAHYHYARHHRALGRLDDSARWFESAAALRPEDYSVPALLASVYVGLRRPDEAQGAQRRALELAEQRLKRVPDDERALYLGAGCLSSLGNPSRAREWAKRAVAMEPDDSAVLYNVACVYALLGLKDSAIDCLERALANGFGHWEWIAHDSDLDTLRAHPRFTALTTR
jgi:TolB-like protein/tetratricopeptide (TPR) repeat protein